MNLVFRGDICEQLRIKEDELFTIVELSSDSVGYSLSSKCPFIIREMLTAIMFQVLASTNFCKWNHLQIIVVFYQKDEIILQVLDIDYRGC